MLLNVVAFGLSIDIFLSLRNRLIKSLKEEKHIFTLNSRVIFYPYIGTIYLKETCISSVVAEATPLQNKHVLREGSEMVILRGVMQAFLEPRCPELLPH